MLNPSGRDQSGMNSLQSTRFANPPETSNGDGEPRRAGFELEFGGLETAAAAQIVADSLGGRVRRVTAFEYAIDDTPWGQASLEVDATLLKERSYLRLLEDLGFELDPDDTDRLDDLLQRLATSVVPLEVVTPPVPLTELAVLDELRERLRREGAEGTDASLLYAFGLHINPEAPSLEVGSIVATLRAFLLLYDWIVHEAPIDLTRRIAPYIEPFGEAYARRVLDPDYRPDLEALIADYTEANPTRNRALDLLPLFAHASGESFEGVSPRPAYHYRLPNCRVSDPDWRIAHEWNGWICVERVAARDDWLEEGTASFLEGDPSGLRRLVDEWMKSP